MLVRLMYASRAVDAVDMEELQAILRQSKANNPALGVTGVLCFCFAERIFIPFAVGGGIVSEPLTFDLILSSFYTIWIKADAEEPDAERARFRHAW